MTKCILTPDEKAACFRMGALIAGAEAHVPVSVLTKALCHQKSAQSIADGLDSMAKGITVVSVLTGLPLGISAHLVGKSIKARSNKERELEARRDYYHNTAKNLETRMSGLV